MFRKLPLLFLSMLICLCACACAEATEAAVPRPQSVLPALPSSPAWYGAGSGAAPDVRSSDDDGNALLTYHGVSAEDYAAYSEALAQAGFTLTTHLYSGSAVMALLTDGETDLRVEYDTILCEMTIALPETAFLRAWAAPANIADFWGEWALDWYWEDGELSREEEYAPHLFLSEAYCHKWNENVTVAFDGRLLTLSSEREEYVLFFDASGMLHMTIVGEEGAANLTPVGNPFWLLGTWKVVEAMQDGEVVEQEENWALCCAPEGVYELLDGEVFSGPYPWVNAYGNNATFEVEGLRYYLARAEGDVLIMKSSFGNDTVQVKMEPRVDISELLGAWRVTAQIEDGVEVPADQKEDLVLLIAEDGIVLYEDGEPQEGLTWAVLGTWPGGAVLVQRHSYGEYAYLFTLGEDGRLYEQQEEGVILTLDPDFRPAAAEPEAAAEEPVRILNASAKGLLSDVRVVVLLAADGTIAGISVDASGETEAIARPCTEEAFLSQFIGKAGPFDGIDVVSGATFTSNAVIEAVNSLFPAEEILTGTAKGFASDVTVTLTVADGVIVDIAVDSANETPGFGTRCGEDEEFLAQFIGREATPDLGEGIDALAGATVTSRAVVEAANAAIGAAATEEPLDDLLTASAKGLLSDVTVMLTLHADGTIATISVDASGETEAIARPCTEEAFLSQFIGKAGPFDDIDVVSGATFTSNAVIEAVNSLFPAE